MAASTDLLQTKNGVPQDDFRVEEEAPPLSSTHFRQQGGWVTLPFMAVTIFGLTLTSGWGSNLIVFLIEKFNIKSIDAAQISNVVNGSTNFLPIVAAIVADSFFGSFLVIVVSSILSLLGVILFTLSVTIPSLRPPECLTMNGSSLSCQSPSTLQFAVLYIAITLGSLGLGGTRYTIATMGADQFNKPKDQATFFNWYFFCLYIAAVVNAVGIVYIQDNIGWGLGFGVCVAANIVGLVVFLSGNRYYCHVKPKGSPFTSLARVIVATVKKRNVLVSSSSSSSSSEIKSFYYGDSMSATIPSSSSPTSSFRFLNRAALITDGDTKEDGSISKPWRLCTVQQVEDLKTLIRIFPLWSSSFFLSVPIGIQAGLVVLQALTMNRHIIHNFKIPAASFLVFSFLSTAISLTFIDRFLFPTYQKLTRKILTPLQRVGIGHVLNIIGMSTSALIESRRLHIVHSHHLEQPNIVPMSALWQILPLTIVGIGEAFHFPGQVDLYYKEFPTSLRSTSTAMISLLVAIGFYLSTAVISLIQRVTKWLPNNINEGRIDKVFWLLVVIGVINFGYFIMCSVLYKYQNVDDSGQKSTPVDNHQSIQED